MTAKEHNSAGTSRKDAAMAFLRLAASGKAREAFQSHAGPGFRHHNPFFRGDADSLMIAMEENAANNPNKVLEIQRALEDGDLVAVHSRVRLGRLVRSPHLGRQVQRRSSIASRG